MKASGKWLVAAGLTLLGAWIYQQWGREPVEALLRASAGSGGDGVERWRIEPIYEVLSGRLFLRGAALAWTLPLFFWAFTRLRRRSEGLAKTLFSGYASCFLWGALELLAAPFLIKPLELYNFYFVLDVDHRLPAHHAGIGTNGDGLRTDLERGESREEPFHLLFAGDSFTFGFRVEPEEAFPARIETLLAQLRPEIHPRAINLGWTSSSPLLSLRLLEELGDEYHPDALVYSLDMTDFHDDIKYGNMLQRRGIYWWFDKTPIALRLLQEVWPGGFDTLYWRTNDNLPRERFFHSEQPLEASRPFMRPTLENLRRLDEWAQAREIPFAVVVLPRSYQYSSKESPDNREAEFYTVLGPFSHEPFRFFDEVRESERFPIFSVLTDFEETEVFPTSFDDDPHWTPAGHQVAADAILEALESHDFFPDPPEAP